MTPEQKKLIQRSFEQVRAIGDAAARLFYARLFDLDPSLQLLFKGNMDEQGKKLMEMLGLVVRGLDRLNELLPAVEALGRRHATYGVQDRHYKTVGAALLWTLDKGLGPAFTPDVREAWKTVYEVLAGAMKEAVVYA